MLGRYTGSAGDTELSVHMRTECDNSHNVGPQVHSDLASTAGESVHMVWRVTLEKDGTECIYGLKSHNV